MEKVIRLGDEVMVKAVVDEIRQTKQGLQFNLKINSCFSVSWVTVKESEIESEIEV